jgi:hypothetical protein
MLTVAPAGIVAPFEPVTGCCTVAVTWSPTAFVPVQIFDDEFVVSVAPAGIIPTAPPPVSFDDAPLGFDVTVFPFEVVVAAGGITGGLLGREGVRGVVRSGARFFVGDLAADGAGASGVVAGTSFNCGCAAESRPASARSRFNVLSAPSAVLSGPFFASDLHAATTVNAATIIGVPKRRIYFDMLVPPGVS